MELVEGRPLSHALEGRPLPIGQILELGSQIADARYVYFGWREPRGDIWVADLFPSR